MNYPTYSSYTIQVQQKEFEDLGFWDHHATANSLEEARDLIAKIDLNCKARIIHVVKQLIETINITKDC